MSTQLAPFRGSSRNVIETHIPNKIFRKCKVCQQAIDDDHDEALRIASIVKPFFPSPYPPPRGYGFPR